MARVLAFGNLIASFEANQGPSDGTHGASQARLGAGRINPVSDGRRTEATNRGP